MRDCGSGSSTGLNVIIPPRRECGTAGAVVLLVSIKLFAQFGSAGMREQ